MAIQRYLNSAIALYVAQGSLEVELPIDKEKGKGKESEREMIDKELTDLRKNSGEKEGFEDEHVYKLFQVAMECLREGIIDPSLALDAMKSARKEFSFQSITTDFVVGSSKL